MSNEERPERIVPVLEEELITSKRTIKTGSVRVDKHVERRTENVTMPLLRETVDVKRIPINREVDSIPAVRTFGDTTIISVVEEQIVVTKKLVVVEEIHMTTRRSRQEETIRVPVDKERVEIVRLDAQGSVVEQESRKEPQPSPIGHHRPVLTT